MLQQFGDEIYVCSRGNKKENGNTMMEKYLGKNMIATKADAINNNIDFKLAQHSDMMLKQMALLLANSNGDDNTNDPPRKYQCIQQDGNAIVEVTHLLGPATLPASPQKLIPKGKDARASSENN
jgi:hypothetical protein